MASRNGAVAVAVFAVDRFLSPGSDAVGPGYVHKA
jgi:hypothetical protein